MAVVRSTDGFRTSARSNLDSGLIVVPVLGVDSVYSGIDSEDIGEAINAKKIRVRADIEYVTFDATTGAFPNQKGTGIWSRSYIIINDHIKMFPLIGTESVMEFDGKVRTVKFFHFVRYTVPGVAQLYLTPAGVTAPKLNIVSSIVFTCD